MFDVPDFPVVFVRNLDAKYRRDVASQEKFEKFLSNNIERLHDPYWNRGFLTIH